MNIYKTLLLLITVLISAFCAAQENSKSLTVGKSDVLHSKILKEDRIINIYLPEN